MKHSFPVEYGYKSTRDGQVTSDLKTHANVSCEIPESKESVDIGGFTPGVFRINPYYVSSGEVSGSSSSFEAIYSYLEFWKRYTIVTKCSGKVMVPVVAQGNMYTAKPSTATYEQIALQKATSKVRNADLALGEALGEYRQTVSMLRDPLKNLRKFLWDDRQRNLNLLIALMRADKRSILWLRGRTSFAAADELSSTWLELRYGLRPLVMLLQDIVEKVKDAQKVLFDPDKIWNARTRLSWTENNTVNSSGVYGYQKINSSIFVEDKISASASIQYRCSGDQSFLDQLGLTPRFLPETAFELTRLSFLVDWIFTIGPWLGTLRLAPGVTILGNTVGIKVARTCRPMSTQVRANYTGASWKNVASDCEIKYNTYERKTNVDLSYLPHFTWGRTLDLAKAVDALTLIWGLRVSKYLKQRK